MKGGLKMSRFRDLTGRKFDRLKVVERAGTYTAPDGISQQPIWLCQCSCGNISYVTTRNLLSGATKSCGCLRKEHCSRLSAARYSKKGVNKDA